MAARLRSDGALHRASPRAVAAASRHCLEVTPVSSSVRPLPSSHSGFMGQAEIAQQVAHELECVCPDGVAYSGAPASLLAILRPLPDRAGMDALIEA